MIRKHAVEVTEEFLKYADLSNPEEFVIRQLIQSMLENLPISELTSIFKITIHTGNDPIDSTMPDWYIQMILDLERRGIRKYEVEYVGNKEQNNLQLPGRSDLQQSSLEGPI